MIEDIIYYTSLIVCVTLGSYYKKIKDPELKRHYGAGLGIFVACLVCGQYLFHSICMVWGNIVLIKCCDRRLAHQVSMAYTWLYLVYLHLHINSMYVLWIHQALALRLVGIAFEMSSTRKTVPLPLPDEAGESYRKDYAKPSTSKGTANGLAVPRRATPRSSLTPKVTAIVAGTFAKEPTALDIIAYTYFFVGLHKGPFFRWKIYQDHFNLPFSELSDYRVITEHKLKKAFLCAVANLILRMRFSPEKYYEDDFYNEYGTDDRFLYNVPQLVIFLLQHQMLMMLCTCVCTEAGFGAYPAKCEPLPGHGPSVRQSLIQIIAENRNLTLEQDYNFSVLKCFENKKLVFGPRMRDTLQGWDMPTRYWFWSNVYKNLLSANKEVRSASSFLAWSIWCGLSLQQLIVSSTLWVYINLEQEYAYIYDTKGPMQAPWDIGFSIMRLFCLIYLTPCFIISDSKVIVKYYSSIYWVFHLLLFIFIVGAIVAYKSKQE